MILNGKVINPGELRIPIVLKSRAVASGAGGFASPTYTTLASVKAKWVNAHGAELLADNAKQAEGLATALIRYLVGVDNTVIVEKDSLAYEITSVDDIQEKHEYIEFKVKRMKAG
jgi:SPP1 family predicted phage head-tail adaptor